MAQYAWNSITQTVPNGVNAVEFLGNNPLRVSLIVASSVGTGMRLCNFGGTTFQGLWNLISSQIPMPMTYRDYGPVIQAPLFVSHTSGSPIVITVTEVYRLPGC